MTTNDLKCCGNCSLLYKKCDQLFCSNTGGHVDFVGDVCGSWNHDGLLIDDRVVQYYRAHLAKSAIP